MLQPKPLTLKRQDGTERTFILSKFPAVDGREIVAKYPVANLPKLGDYAVSEATMLKVMGFVGVELEGRETPLLLSTRELVNNHAGDWETLAKLEWAMLEYNCSFFGQGLTSGSFAAWMDKAKPLISQILTALSEQSSGAAKQPSTT